MKQEKKTQMFLALTKLHRDIVNNKKVAIYPLFQSFGFCYSQTAGLKAAMLKMRIIYEKDNRLYWNSEKCLPNPQLVEGILLTRKEMRKAERESKEVKVKIKVTPKETMEKSAKETIQVAKGEPLEKVLKSILSAGVNPTIVIVCS